MYTLVFSVGGEVQQAISHPDVEGLKEIAQEMADEETKQFTIQIWHEGEIVFEFGCF